MANITSAAVGNWSSTASWVGGVAPGSGDTAFINHQITLDGVYQIAGISSTSTGSLIAGQGGYRLQCGSPEVCYSAHGVSVSGRFRAGSLDLTAQEIESADKHFNDAQIGGAILDNGLGKRLVEAARRYIAIEEAEASVE